MASELGIDLDGQSPDFPALLKRMLFEFMYENHYQIEEPVDVTLNFNKKNAGNFKISKQRRLRNMKGLKGSLKRLVYRIGRKLFRCPC